MINRTFFHFNLHSTFNNSHITTESWEEYDERLQELAEYLADVPSLIVLEPALLMHTFNSATNYHNAEYQVRFRAHFTNAHFRKWTNMSIKCFLFVKIFKLNLSVTSLLTHA